MKKNNKRTQQIIDYWDKRAHDYDRSSLIAAKAYPTILARVKEVLQPEDRVLDIGSGTGGFTIQYINMVKHVTCSDLSPKMLALSRERLSEYTNVDFSLQDCTDLKLPPGSYDVVLCINVLHQMHEPQKAIQQFHRVLKPGGRLIAISVAQKDMRLLNKLSVALRYSLQYGVPPAMYRLSLRSLSDLIQQYQFSIARSAIITRSPFPVAMVVAVK